MKNLAMGIIMMATTVAMVGCSHGARTDGHAHNHAHKKAACCQSAEGAERKSCCDSKMKSGDKTAEKSGCEDGACPMKKAEGKAQPAST